MSENTTATNAAPATTPKKEKPDLTKVVPISVNRNTVDLALTPFAGSRGAWDGVVYQAPQLVSTVKSEVNNETMDDITNDVPFLKSLLWFGKSNIINMVNVVAKRMSQDNWADATDEKTGIFDQTKFVQSTTAWAAAALRISELKELYNEAVEKMTAAQQELLPKILACNGDQDKIKEVGAWFQGFTDQVNSYKNQLEERSQRRSKEAETDTVRAE